MVTKRTRYLLFLDESGTHDLNHVDPSFPVFVLLGLLVGETYYAKTLVPRVKELKRRYCGTHEVVLHSRDIRKAVGPFAFLRKNDSRKENFYADLNSLFIEARIRLFAVVIEKQRFTNHFLVAPNPYDVSLNQMLSIVCGPPRIVGPMRPTVAQIIAESRGKVEDKQLQREYQSSRQSGLWNYGSTDVQNRKAGTVRRLFPERIDFVRKSRFVAGLEMADLAAYPIARAMVNGDWTNPAVQVVARKLKTWVVYP
jgi:hypothetical protein